MRIFPFIIFCFICCINSCDRRIGLKEARVKKWLENMPPKRELFPSNEPKTYNTLEEWVKAGEKIEEIEPILLRFYKGDYKYPIPIIIALGYFGTKESVSLLLEILMDEKSDRSKKQEAAKSLGLIGNTSAVEFLCQALSSTDERMPKFTIVKSLAMIGDPCSVSVIEASFEYNKYTEYEKTYFIQFLESLKNNEKVERRKQVVLWYGRCPLEPVFVRKQEYYSSKSDWIVACYKIDDIEEILTDIFLSINGPGQNKMIKYLDHAGSQRGRVIQSLGYVGTRKSVPMIIEYLETNAEQDNTMSEVVNTLGLLSDKTSIEPIARLCLNHKDGAIRLNAVNALRAIGDIEAVPFLENALKNPSLSKEEQDEIKVTIKWLKERDMEEKKREI